MAGWEVYNFDNNGESFPSNCFPVRSFFHQRKEGGGHWLVAHRNCVEERYRTQKNKKPGLFRTGPYVQSKSEKSEKRVSKTAGNTLSGQLLMELHCVDKPSDLCSVDISERKFQSIKLEGLEEFDNVAYINASDNSLTLEPFSRFPALRELELSLNSLCTLKVHAEGFPKLEILDLSYNNLSNDGILAVGQLPCLKVLHLTGNNLKILPHNMAGSYAPPDEAAQPSSSIYEALEVLMLDHNKLTSPGVFSSLAKLKRLKHLNLQGNHISEVPYLQHMPRVQLPAASVLKTEPIQKNVMRMEFFSDSQEVQKEFRNIASEVQGLVEYSEDFSPPLPQLQYLNLSSNKIAEEEALLAVALLPNLRELVIHSNPLTLHRGGNPPGLTWFLQEMLGIDVRGKITIDNVKPHIVLPVNTNRNVVQFFIYQFAEITFCNLVIFQCKCVFPHAYPQALTLIHFFGLSVTVIIFSLLQMQVKTKIPKVPLGTSALCISESQCTDRGNKYGSPLPSECRSTDVLLPCSSQTSTQRKEDIARTSGFELLEGENTDIPQETHQTEEPFFVTELNDLLETESQEKAEKTEEICQFVKKGTECPGILTGYEALLDDNMNLDMPRPVDKKFATCQIIQCERRES